jgi:hypothetical protein
MYTTRSMPLRKVGKLMSFINQLNDKHPDSEALSYEMGSCHLRTGNAFLYIQNDDGEVLPEMESAIIQHIATGLIFTDRTSLLDDLAQQEYLRHLLLTSGQVEVTFRKKNGDMRTMNIHMNSMWMRKNSELLKIVPEGEYPATYVMRNLLRIKEDDTENTAWTVWDVECKGWRRFRLDSVVRMKSQSRLLLRVVDDTEFEADTSADKDALYQDCYDVMREIKTLEDLYRNTPSYGE